MKPTATTAETSPKNKTMKTTKKELAVWDALVIADENRYKKELERKKLARKT